MHPWYAAQSQPGLERTAVHHLLRVVPDAYAPAAEQRGIFSGYVFVSMETLDQCYSVNRARGIVRLLPVHAERPLPLPGGFVDELRASVGRGDFSDAAQQEFVRRYVPGEAVEALSGAMRDQCGRFLRYSKGCGVLLGHLLGRNFEYKVPLHQLRPASGSLPPELRSTRAV